MRGGVFLYKNCSENAEAAPQQFYRRQQAVENLIRSNVIVGAHADATNYGGVNIASRQWAEEWADKPCGDKGGMVLPEDAGDRPHFPDYASDNTVSDNVIFAPGLAVRVKDDDNKVLNNQFYVPVGSTARVLEVGTPRDLTYGGGPLKGTVIDGNWVDDYNGTHGTSTVHDDLFRLRERSMEHSEFSNNRYLGEAVCRLPFTLGQRTWRVRCVASGSSMIRSCSQRESGWSSQMAGASTVAWTPLAATTDGASTRAIAAAVRAARK